MHPVSSLGTPCIILEEPIRIFIQIKTFTVNQPQTFIDNNPLDHADRRQHARVDAGCTAEWIKIERLQGNGERLLNITGANSIQNLPTSIDVCHARGCGPVAKFQSVRKNQRQTCILRGKTQWVSPRSYTAFDGVSWTGTQHQH